MRKNDRRDEPLPRECKEPEEHQVRALLLDLWYHREKYGSAVEVSRGEGASRGLSGITWEMVEALAIEDAEEILDTIQGLPPMLEDCVVLVYYADLSASTVAADTDITVSALRRRLVVATKILRRRLRRHQSERVLPVLAGRRQRLHRRASSDLRKRIEDTAAKNFDALKQREEAPGLRPV